MRLIVTTPTAQVEDIDSLLSLRAEDATGSFGIQPGHADFVTVLPISVITWRTADREGHVVVQRGVLIVRDGNAVDIAARGAWREDQLAELGPMALAKLEQEDSEEAVTRTFDHRMHLATMRQVERLLNGGRQARADAPRVPARTGSHDAESGP